MTEKVLILRTSDRNRRSYGGFQWPESGSVEAPDWDPSPVHGNGLHGALWGEGNGILFNWALDATWQVVEVNADSVVDLGWKVKFPRGEVVYSGDRKGATEMIFAHPGGKDRAVIGATISVGDGDIVTVGYLGTARAGDRGTVTAGRYGTAQTGAYGTSTSGYEGKAITGHHGKATVGNRGIAQASRHGIAIAGVNGTAIAGDYGTATADIGGMAITKACGEAQAGLYGKAQAGVGGLISIKWVNPIERMLSSSIGYIGEDGLLPDTLYKVKGGIFVPA